MPTITFPVTERVIIQPTTDTRESIRVNESIKYNEGLYGYWLYEKNVAAAKINLEERILAFGGPTSTGYVNYLESYGAESHFVPSEYVYTTFSPITYSDINLENLENASVYVNTVLNLDTRSLVSEVIDDEIYDFCFLENLLNEFYKIQSMLKISFENITSINTELYTDPEIKNTKQVVFEIYIKNNIKNIIKMENEFYKNLVRNIDRKKLKYFIIKCEKDGPRKFSFFSTRFK